MVIKFVHNDSWKEGGKSEQGRRLAKVGPAQQFVKVYFGGEPNLE